MGKITREELQAYKKILEMEKDMLNRIISSNEDIYKVAYADNMIVILFKNGKQLTNDYLEKLNQLIDYQRYTLEVATITEEFFKMKYTEQVLRLNIYL